MAARKDFPMRNRMMLMGLSAALALALALPAAAQPSPEQEAANKAEMAKMMADPALSLQANADYLANTAKQPGMQRRTDGLLYKILQNGYGRHPFGGDNVEVYYTLKLINGKLIDGTSPGLPATFPVTVGKLIQGWVEVLQLMRVGDHWQVVIPATLGYGVKGSPDGGIPPNQALVFDIRLLSTETPAKKPDSPDDAQQ